MKHSILRSNSFKPTVWSGGTTTELFIFPPEASYAQRNFHFRLSTATVDTDKSDFTSLPGVLRVLMVLSGKTSLHHQGQYTKHLDKFEVDTFKGDWKTSSEGKCTDFNLMTRGATTGKIKALVVKKEQTAAYNTSPNCDWILVYLFFGQITIDINNEINTLNKGDLLVLSKPMAKRIAYKGIEDSEVILTELTVEK